MKKKIWKSFDERPEVADGYYFGYIAVTDGLFMSTAIYNPADGMIAPVILDQFKPIRRWCEWDDCNFTMWSYISDLIGVDYVEG